MKKATYKLGVFGSAAGDFSKIHEIILDLGKKLAESKVVVVAGAYKGLPFEVCQAVANHQGEIWLFPPYSNLEKLKLSAPGVDFSIYKNIVFIPESYEFKENLKISQKYRNVITCATVDAGIIISGRWGTLNEFTNLTDMGKIVGVLTGTGGIADEVQNLTEKINKPGSGEVISEGDPIKLVDRIIAALQETNV